MDVPANCCSHRYFQRRFHKWATREPKSLTGGLSYQLNQFNKPILTPGHYDVNDFFRHRKTDLRSIVFVHGTKLYTITPDTFTGLPSSSVGENPALQAAISAACLNNGWPDRARAE